MIKINLLPARSSKKKETAKQQIAIFAVSVVVVLAISSAVYIFTLGKIKQAKDDISNAEREIQSLKTKIGEIDNIKKLQAEVKKKLDVLGQLRKEKTGPAFRLARLSDAVPEKLWLTKYSESGANVSINGVAFSEELIADFMRSLLASGEFVNVELLVSEQAEVSGTKVKKFEITCIIKNLKREEPPKK